MHLTVINMGKKEIALRVRDVILTLLVFRLRASVEAGYSQRQEAFKKTKESSGPAVDSMTERLAPEIVPREQQYIGKMLENLAPDFMDFRSTARRIALKQTNKRVGIVSVIASIVLVVAGVGVDYLNTKFRAEVRAELKEVSNSIERRISVIEAVQKGDQRLGDLEVRLRNLEDKMNTAPR